MAEITVDEARSGTVVRKKARPYLIDLFVRLVKEKPLGFFGFCLVFIMFFVGIFANYLAP